MKSTIHAAGLALVLLAMQPAAAAQSDAKRSTGAGDRLQQYLQEARQAGAPPAASNSLWDDRAAGLVGDFKARRVGDIVTVVVREATDAVTTATSQAARTSQQSTSIPLLSGAERRFRELPSLSSATGNSTFSGSGTTTRQSTLSAVVTARVVEVLPNGNLVIEGFRDVRVNSENQNLSLAGVIRARDITPNNEIASSSIAYLEVRLQGKGLVTDHLKPGWLYRLLRAISPF